MVAHRSLHGCQHVGAFVSSQQRQHTLRLFEALALAFEKPFQERRSHFSQPGELVAQLF